jgi:anaerobic C4-dicarboxylate transporter
LIRVLIIIIIIIAASTTTRELGKLDVEIDLAEDLIARGNIHTILRKKILLYYK